MSDSFNIVLLKFLLKSVPRVLSTESFNSRYERKVSNLQTTKAQPNLFPLPKESCSVSHNSLLSRGAKLISFLLETDLCSIDFWIRIKRKTLEHMQHVIVKNQISCIFSTGLLIVVISYFIKLCSYSLFPTLLCYIYYILHNLLCFSCLK